MQFSDVQLDGVSLQLAHPDDAATVSAVMQRIYRALYAYLWIDGGESFLNTIFSPHALRRELEDKNQPCWIICCEGKQIGILKLTLDVAPGDIPDAHSIKLHRIYMDAAFHGRGIGSAILRFVEDTARSAGAHNIWLESMASEPGVRKFYEKHGYAYVKDVTLPYPNGKPEFSRMLRMENKLEN
ncbi:MAG: GNAT family N-acetyltransferase [Alphaproteobacteria bacterium]